MKYYKKLVGETVYLSPMSIEDAEIYARWLNDSDITDGLGSTSRIVSLDSERDWISENAGLFQFAIIRKSDDLLLGNCGLEGINSVRRCATIGIFIGEEENRRKGYATEAMKLALDYGFRYLNLHNIMLMVFDFNDKAVACYEKIGFKRIGERRESYYIHGEYHNEIYYDIVKEEWLEMYPEPIVKKNRGND